MDSVIIKMGEVKVAKDASLVTFGVGSCVVIILYDREAHIGGMAHTMLTTDKATHTQMATNPLRYVEMAIPELIKEMVNAGASKRHLVAYLTGGAQMFTLYRAPSNTIGPSNVDAAQRVLSEAGIPIIDEDIGGKRGRNVHFDCSTGAWAADTNG